MKNLAELYICKVFLVIHCYHFCTEISTIKRFLPLVEMTNNIIRQAELVFSFLGILVIKGVNLAGFNTYKVFVSIEY